MARGVSGGYKTVAAAATPEPLMTAADAQAGFEPISMIHVSAPYNQATGAAINTKIVRMGFGDDPDDYSWQLDTTDMAGFYIPVSNPSDLMIDVGADGEGIKYSLLR